MISEVSCDTKNYYLKIENRLFKILLQYYRF